jgi:hypothetical protein
MWYSAVTVSTGTGLALVSPKELTEWTLCGIGEIKEINVEVDACAVGVGDTCDLTMNGFALLKYGLEGSHGWVVHDYGCILCFICEDAEGERQYGGCKDEKLHIAGWSGMDDSTQDPW